jgi:hypothetical protein
MKKSENVREFITILRNVHCRARDAAVVDGEPQNVASHAMAAEALLAVDAFLSMEFGLDEMYF